MTEPTDAAVAQEEIRRREDYQFQEDAWTARITTGDAERMTNWLSGAPTLTPDTAAAMLASPVEWDNTTLATIARHDYERQEEFSPWTWTKAGIRGAATGAESLWEAGVPTIGRTITRVAQGENPVTAYRESNQNYLSEIARQHSMGNPIEIGNGLFPRSTPTIEREGFGGDFKTAFNQTQDVNASLEIANQKSLQKYGTVLTEDVHDINNSTLVNRTIDGRTYSAPYSAGRALAIQVTRPDTTPFNVMSSLVDGTLRITADPLNAPLYEVTAAMTARNRIIRDMDETVADQVRRMRADRFGISTYDETPELVQEFGGNVIADAVTGSGRHAPEERSVRMFLDRIEDSYNNLKEAAKVDPNGRYYDAERPGVLEIDKFGEHADEVAEGLPNPYGEWNPELTNAQALEVFENQGGYRAYEDFVLEHELVHADESTDLFVDAQMAGRTELTDELYRTKAVLSDAADQANVNAVFDANGRPKFMDEDLARYDAARAEFEMAQAEYNEFITPIVREMESRAERVAFERLMDPDATLQATKLREDLYKQAGLRHRWRKWLKPNEASSWINSKQADAILGWLQGEHRYDQIAKRLPDLPYHVQRQLGRATDRASIVELLMPHLGVEIDKVPKLGAAKFGRYGNKVQFDPTRPGAGSVTHTFSSKLSEQIRLTGRRLGAESMPIVLNPHDAKGTATGAVAWLKTVRATDDEIESVMRLIDQATGQRSMGKTVEAAERMQAIMVRRMKELGYNADDIAKVMKQMNDDQVGSTLYWVDNATTPQEVHRWDDAYETIIGVNGEEEVIGHLSAATEAQFSSSYIGMPNLRDTRRATAPFRAGRESVMRTLGGHWGVKAERLGLDPGWILFGADKVQGVWRTAMLLRFGWPVRVVGEEMLRAHAYGYGHWFSHPIDVLAQIGNSEAKVSLLGDSLREIGKLDGLGTGGWRDVEQTFDMARANWTTARHGQAGYEAGMVQELLQLRGSRLARVVAQYGPEEAYQMVMRNQDNLMDVVHEIGKHANKNSTLYRMGNNPEVLRRHLESLDAMIHQQGGGAWIQRTKGGPWKDMAGNEVPSLMEQYTRAELLEIATEAQIPGRHSMSKADLADSIYQASGRPNLDKVDDAQQFIIVENGNDRVRTLVSDGTWGDEVWLTDEMNVEQIQGIENKIVDAYESENVYGPKVVRTMTEESREARSNTIVDRAFELLMAKPSMALARNPHFITRYTEEVARMYLTAGRRERAMIEAWVGEAGFGSQFRRAMGKILDQHGLKTVPGEALTAVERADGTVHLRAARAGDEPPLPPEPVPIFDEVPDSVYNDIAINEYLEEAARRDLPPEQYRPELLRRIEAGEVTAEEVLEAAEAVPFGDGTMLDVMRNDGILQYEPNVPNPALDAHMDLVLGVDPYAHLRGVGGGLSHEALQEIDDVEYLQRQLTLLQRESDQAKIAASQADDWSGESAALNAEGRAMNVAEVELRIRQLGEEPRRAFVPYGDGEMAEFARLREFQGDEFASGEFNANVERYLDITNQAGNPVEDMPNLVGTVDSPGGKLTVRTGRPTGGDSPIMWLVTDENEVVGFYAGGLMGLDEAYRGGGAMAEAITMTAGTEVDIAQWLMRRAGGDPTDMMVMREFTPESAGVVRRVATNVTEQEPLIRLHEEILEGWKNGTVRQADIDEAIGRAVSRNNIDDPATLDRLTELNTELSGISGEARGFNPNAGSAAREGATTASVPDWFSNRAMGIMTDDQILLDTIDRIARQTALEDTKALFYDLTRRKNFTDMAKFVFPFGDAFLEQLRIWSRAMTPVGEQTGQALKNWRRAQVGVTNAHKSGWFSEDKFGNEVMNWPGAGLMTGVFGMPDDTGMDATIQPDQLMMMNLTPRGMGLPGTSPFIQLPAAMVQHKLDRFPAIRDMMNWFAFGDYSPASMANMGDAFAAVSPTWARRLMSRLFGDESKEEYGNEIAQIIEALIASNDPRYGDDPERANITVKDAQSLGSTLGMLRILDGVFQPAQPIYNPEILIELAGKDPFWMTITALQDEWRATRDYFGEEAANDAIDYFRKTYGVDPLILVGATREVVSQPVTKEAYDEKMKHLEKYEQLGPAVMLFLPSSDIDPFYLPAYQTTLREDDRQRLEGDQVMVQIQKAKGYNQLEAIASTFEAQAVAIDKAYQGDHRNAGWSVAMDDLNRWKQMAQQDVYAMFPPVHPEANTGKLMDHPSYHDVVQVVVAAGTPGTNEFAISAELQPELHEWVTQFSQAWRNIKELSMVGDTKGHSDQWWLTSTSEPAERMRQDFAVYLNGIQQEIYAKYPDKRESLEIQVGWFMSRAIEPLFDGYSLDDQMYLARTETPPYPMPDEQGATVPPVEDAA